MRGTLAGADSFEALECGSGTRYADTVTLIILSYKYAREGATDII
jgi:hypothetical protein